MKTWSQKTVFTQFSILIASMIHHIVTVEGWLFLDLEILSRRIVLVTPSPNNVLSPLYPRSLHMLAVTSAANRLIGEVVQLRRRPLLGPSHG